MDCDMTREQFDRDHAQAHCNGGVLYPWRILTGMERVGRVALLAVMAVIVLAGSVGAAALAGAVMDGVLK